MARTPRLAAGRARALGLPTRGTTNPNRLRRVDRWVAHTYRDLLAAPQPLVVDLVDEQMGCDIGVEGRAGTQTTSYVWEVGSREYDAVVGPEVWGDWAKVRDLTTEEFLGLDCVLGEETVIVGYMQQSRVGDLEACGAAIAQGVDL